MMTDVLTGVISGGAFGLTPYSNLARLDVSHSFTAIDISWFMPIKDFKARMDDFIGECKASKLRPGFDEILVPGEIDYRRESEYRRTGAKIDSVVFEQLRDLASDLNIPFTLE